MQITKFKSMEEALSAHDGNGSNLLMTKKQGDSIVILERFNGIGALSYATIQMTLLKTGGFFGLFKKASIMETLIDVDFTFGKAVDTFATASRA